MSPKNLTLSALMLASAGFVLSAGSAHAEGASFCQLAERNCIKLYAKNVSSATVKSVALTQEQGDKSCEAGLKKTIKKNLSGGTDIAPGEKVTFYADKTCRYKVKFKTTKGCLGDKTTHIGAVDLRENRDTAVLKGGCGTLKARTTFVEPNFQKAS